jgi:long-chain acyl-CoA synthetase
MHRASAARFGSRVALRFREHGPFRDLSWTAYRRQADRAACALIDLGIEPGDRIGILSENRYEWLVADIAVLSTGAADVPLHAPLSAEQVAYQLGHSGARGVIVSGQAQADKVFASLSELPELEFLISFDAIETDDRIRCVTWDRVTHHRIDDQHTLSERAAQLDRDSLATIIYTSGTTGNPKGVMLSHGNLISNAEAMLAVMPSQPSETFLSWLPYSHIYARTVDHYLSILSGMTVNLSAAIEEIVGDLDATQPHWFTAVPRFYEQIWTSVEHLEDDRRSREIHRVFGSRMRYLTSGGAPLPRHVCQGFHDAGLPIHEGYGLTESSPVICFNNERSHRIGTVGQAIPDVEVRIADDGEILTRGPHVMQGYWRNPEATAEAIIDGWLLTGDVGQLDDDGFLTITDRKKDLLITSGGKNIAPSVIERLLVSDPWIDQAVLYGDGRKFVSALLVPNFDKLAETAEELGCDLDDTTDFVTDERIIAFYTERVVAVMQTVSNPERVKRFLLLGRPFRVEEDELTATLKVRRRHIIGKYEEQLAALYGR